MNKFCIWHTAKVSPIWDKILNPGIRLVEKKAGKPEIFSGFEVPVTVICATKTQYHFEITTVDQCVIHE